MDLKPPGGGCCFPQIGNPVTLRGLQVYARAENRLGDAKADLAHRTLIFADNGRRAAGTGSDKRAGDRRLPGLRWAAPRAAVHARRKWRPRGMPRAGQAPCPSLCGQGAQRCQRSRQCAGRAPDREGSERGDREAGAGAAHHVRRPAAHHHRHYRHPRQRKAGRRQDRDIESGSRCYRSKPCVARRTRAPLLQARYCARGARPPERGDR